MALITWTIWGQRPDRDRHMRTLTGDVALSANSQFPTSAIEKYFKGRCVNVVVTTSSTAYYYKRSAVKGYGTLETLTCSVADVMLNSVVSVTAPVSGTFIATGW